MSEDPGGRCVSAIDGFELVRFGDVGSCFVRFESCGARHSDGSFGADDRREADLRSASNLGVGHTVLREPDFGDRLVVRVGKDLHRVFAAGVDDGAEADRSHDDADEDDDGEAERCESTHELLLLSDVEDDEGDRRDCGCGPDDVSDQETLEIPEARHVVLLFSEECVENCVDDEDRAGKENNSSRADALTENSVHSFLLSEMKGGNQCCPLNFRKESSLLKYLLMLAYYTILSIFCQLCWGYEKPPFLGAAQGMSLQD